MGQTQLLSISSDAKVQFSSSTIFEEPRTEPTVLGDAPLRPMFPPIFLCHLCTSLLIIANSRLKTEHTHGSDIRVQWSCDIAFLSPFHHSPSFSSFHYFSSFYYFNSNFWYIDMHPTLAGLYPFLLGSPARCAFLLYFMFIYMFKIPY